jgi:hypothetical protein
MYFGAEAFSTANLLKQKYGFWQLWNQNTIFR